MYSLVSASVLAIDLVRHPHGASVADTVDRVLALTPDDLVGLAVAIDPYDVDEVAARESARRRLLAASTDRPRMDDVMRGVRSSVQEGVPTPSKARALAEALSETLLGTLPDLVELLRREQPLADAPADAVQAALDAVIASWTGRGRDQEELGCAMLLREPWDEALSLVPPPLDAHAYGTQGAAVRELLETVPRMSRPAWQAVEAAHWSERGTLVWSTAMHEASRAAFEGDRLTAVARAHLAAARSVRLAGISTTTAAGGVMMAVAAAVQATCVQDLLDEAVAEVLLGPWRVGTATEG